MAPGLLRWNEELSEMPAGEFTWTITPRAGRDTFAAVNTNGSQRGDRPLVLLLPRRFGKLELLEGAVWNPQLADDFVLLPNPGAGGEPTGKIVIRFKSEAVHE